MYHDVHKHMCLCCETVSECTDEECAHAGEDIALVDCPRCANHGQAELPTVPQVLEPRGVHAHVCLLCGHKWDCSNECGFPSGSVSELTCGSCVDHLVALKQKSGTSAGDTHLHDGIMHLHKCMIGNHMWEHDDFACAMENLFDLECPACFVFAS